MIVLPGDTGHPLATKWMASENRRLLDLELEPLLKKAIRQPDGIAPRYATNPLVQVLTYILLKYIQQWKIYCLFCYFRVIIYLAED